MKTLLVLAALLAVVGCKHKEVKPPVVVVPPVVVPTPVPVVHKESEFCKSEGKRLQCGTNEWWHLDCSGKENESKEQVYFSSKDAIMAKAVEKNLLSCIRVYLLSGTDEVLPVVYAGGSGGFGPCLPCQELGGVVAKSLGASKHDLAVKEYQESLDKKKK